MKSQIHGMVMKSSLCKVSEKVAAFQCINQGVFWRLLARKLMVKSKSFVCPEPKTILEGHPWLHIQELIAVLDKSSHFGTWKIPSLRLYWGVGTNESIHYSLGLVWLVWGAEMPPIPQCKATVHRMGDDWSLFVEFAWISGTNPVVVR